MDDTVDVSKWMTACGAQSSGASGRVETSLQGKGGAVSHKCDVGPGKGRAGYKGLCLNV